MTATKIFTRCLALAAAATLMVTSANAACWFEYDDGDREQICETYEYDEDGDVEVREFTYDEDQGSLMVDVEDCEPGLFYMTELGDIDVPVAC